VILLQTVSGLLFLASANVTFLSVTVPFRITLHNSFVTICCSLENAERTNKPGTDWIRGKACRDTLGLLAVTAHDIHSVP